MVRAAARESAGVDPCGPGQPAWGEDVQAKLIVPTDQLHLMARALVSGNSAVPATDGDGKPAKVH